MKRYPRSGRRNDLFAPVLAASEECPLLTGDKDLKAAAEAENIKVLGTLWLVNEMVQAGKIAVHVAHNAYQLMRAHGRKLPWDMHRNVGGAGSCASIGISIKG